MTKRPVIRARWAKSHRFYGEFCADPSICKAAGISVAEGQKFHTDYLEFMKTRGHGPSARTNLTPPARHPGVKRNLRSASRKPPKETQLDATAVLRDLTDVLKNMGRGS